MAKKKPIVFHTGMSMQVDKDNCLWVIDGRDCCCGEMRPDYTQVGTLSPELADVFKQLLEHHAE